MSDQEKTQELEHDVAKSVHTRSRLLWALWAFGLACLLLVGVVIGLLINSRGEVETASKAVVNEQVEKKDIAQEAQQAICERGETSIYDQDLCLRLERVVTEPARGDAGPRGPVGAPGADGADGRNGAPGKTGPRGPSGADGSDGESIIGQIGVQGSRGAPDNDSSIPGPMGPAGLNGTNGADSIVAGPVGPKGEQGKPGADGKDSTVPGPKGDTGDSAPADGVIESSTCQGATLIITTTDGRTLSVENVCNEPAPAPQPVPTP